MFKCEIIKWKERPEKYRRRSENYLECVDKDAQIEYFFGEGYNEAVLSIRRKNLVTEESCGPDLCYKCVDELKRFLNENIKGPITCNCAPFPIEPGRIIEERPQIKPMRTEMGEVLFPIHRQVMSFAEYKFEISNNRDLHISEIVTEVDINTRMYTGRIYEPVLTEAFGCPPQIDIPKYILPNLKNFLNSTAWLIPSSEEIIKNGLEIIREKMKNCDLTVLDYIKLVSSELEFALYMGSHEEEGESVKGAITDKFYDKSNNELYDLIDKFQKNCACTMK